MIKRKWKVIFLLFVFTIILVLILVNFVNNKLDKELEYSISEEQAKVLEIENIKITNISNVVNKKYVTTKVKNKLDQTIFDIKINYTELDKNENKISANELMIEIPLNSNEKAVIAITPQSYTNTINIVGYSYKVGNCNVDVNLENDKIKITKIKDDNIKNGDYEILALSDLKKIDDTNYKLTIKNLSEKNLGNLVLKIAEINELKEYVNVKYVDYNSILQGKKETELLINSNRKEHTLEVIGYTYDDIKNKENIDVDLKSHIANIIKN